MVKFLGRHAQQTWRMFVGALMLFLLVGAVCAQTITEYGETAEPRSITTGPDGNLWFTESRGDRIGRMTLTTGVVTYYRSGMTVGASPRGITAGPDGNLWFTEYKSNRIGKITPAGMITEYSVGLSAGANPNGITAGPDGNLWFTEFSGNRIGKITPAGVITEYSAGLSANAWPFGITAGPDGNLWFTEFSGNRIGKITPAGAITEYSTGLSTYAGPSGITAGPDGNLWFTTYYSNRICKITPAGVITQYQVGEKDSYSLSFDITAGPDGNLWFTEPDHHRIGKITPAGVNTYYNNYNASMYRMIYPTGITTGPDGNLWFTEPDNYRIGNITSTGKITEYLASLIRGGNPNSITAGADGNLWFTEFDGYQIGMITPAGNIVEYPHRVVGGSRPYKITAGPDGNLWFTELFGNRIGKITPTGVITYFNAGISTYADPSSITAGPDGNLWFTEPEGNRIGKITPAGMITEYSVGLSFGAGPWGIAAGPDGNLWFTERYGNRIGKITPTGVITEYSAGLSTGAGLAGITAGPDGNLWFTEYDGNRIGKITSAGVITEYSTGLSASARPYGITAGPDGNLWFTELGGNRIGKITPAGVITEYSAGLSAYAHPEGIIAGPDGNLWFTEPGANLIGKIVPPSWAPTLTTVTLGYGSATIRFTPSPNNGGAATLYTASCAAPGQATRTKIGKGSPLTVLGLTAGIDYTCAVAASNLPGISASSAIGSVTALPAVAATRNALFVNAASSPTKTSVLRLINPDTHSAWLTATAYDEAGHTVGTADADLGTFASQQMLTFTSAQLEAAIGYVPASGTAKYRIVFHANLPSFEVINFVKDAASGNLALAQAQTDRPATGTASTSSIRDALFVNASTSTNKTSVLRLINPGEQSGDVSATAYDEAGKVVGVMNTNLGSLAAYQMRTFTSAQLESAIGYVPASPTAKYSIAFTANLPSFELLNHIKDNATGNLTLGQAQTYDRGAATGSSAVRNALVVNASTHATTTSVIRLVNLYNQGGSIAATAYNEAGNTVGTVSAFLGTLAAAQSAAFTSAQLEAAIGYTLASQTAIYRIAFTVNLPGFELINFFKDRASGNLVLAQTQIDDRAASTTSSSSRNALFINASTSPSKTSMVRLVNLGNHSGEIFATAYDEAGNTVGRENVVLGTLAAQQTLSFSSAQLESLIGYTPSSPTAKYRITFRSDLPGFEVVNTISDVATGSVTLGQAQVD